MIFFTGLHQPSDAQHLAAQGRGAFISAHRLKTRKKPFIVDAWIMDSGAFSTILLHGGYPEPVEVYAAEIRRWSKNGNLLAAVAQDYMCEPHMLAKTGLTIEEHQRLTVERYDDLIACDTGGVIIMPVLQGYAPEDYVRHIRMYGDRLKPGMWVGVGSICKRNADPGAVLAVLRAVKRERPDLLLHGFGLKLTALADEEIRSLLHTADSMAWSFAARRQGRNGNDWREAAQFAHRVETMPLPVQRSLFVGLAA
jgi:hypothetical protein